MAAEVLASGGRLVDLYDAMPSVGRKLLLAGKGGLNLTHAEPYQSFLQRYGAARGPLESSLDDFGPDALRAWARGLGVDTFVGTSGRVFPADMKAAPLLRKWLHRLRTIGVTFHMRHRWLGWEGAFPEAPLVFETDRGRKLVHAPATVLALGGASWPRLGSDGAWTAILEARDVRVAPLTSANCGFDVRWSEPFRARHAGRPVKNVAIQTRSPDDEPVYRKGEFIVTTNGVEGSLIYTLVAPLRDAIRKAGEAILHVDLAPDRNAQRLANELARPRGSSSWSRHLERTIGLRGVKIGLLREVLTSRDFDDVDRLIGSIKSLPIKLSAVRPVDEAISTAGGVVFEALDTHLMMTALPGVFCAGEMLDWEAPTGGYLLTACFATGRRAGLGALHWVENGSV